MKLKDVMYQRKKKSVELAQYLGISPSQVSLFMNERIPIPERHLKKIEVFLQLKNSNVDIPTKKNPGSLSRKVSSDFQVINDRLNALEDRLDRLTSTVASKGSSKASASASKQDRPLP